MFIDRRGSAALHWNHSSDTQNHTSASQSIIAMNRNILTTTIAVLLASPFALRAQNATPTPKPNTQTQPAQLPETVVTARRAEDYAVPDATTATKTDTPIMQTPLSIQVIPQQVLEDQNITKLSEALSNVSGVRAHSAGGVQENIYLRGFLSTATFINGFRIDDDYGMGIRAMTNVDRVEVLKGPAAILYGRVEPGGIVNVIPKQSQATPYYSLEQQVGSWDHYLTSLDATGPLNKDKSLLYRFNLSYDKSGSWRDSVQSEKLFLAPSLTWNISPRTQLTLAAEYSYNPLVWDGGQVVPYDALKNKVTWLPRDQNVTAGEPARGDTLYLSLNWSHQFNDDWSLKYQLNRHVFKQYPDPYYYPSGFNQVGNTWTVDRMLQQTNGSWATTATELDLTGHFKTFGLMHTLLLGADYYRRDVLLTVDGALAPSTTNAFNPHRAMSVVDPTMRYSFDTSANNYGVYVQDQIKFPYGVQLLAGVRSQWVDKEGSSTFGTGQGGTGEPTPDARQADRATTPRVGILWQPIEQISLYGNYAENFGANTGRDWKGQPLNPESAKQKEVGIKTQLFGGKLTASLALFELTKTNVAVADLVHPGFSLAVGEIRSRGPEFDIQGELLPGWNIMAAYTYTDIVVTKSTPGSQYTQGNRMAGVPRNMFSLWSTYEWKGTILHGWKIGAGVTGYSSATDPTNTLNTPGYAVASAMASYEFKIRNCNSTLQLNINNLFDRSYYTDLSTYADANIGYLQYGSPRSFTVSMKLEF
jgi:iron complex outermembrane receptor protein